MRTPTAPPSSGGGGAHKSIFFYISLNCDLAKFQQSATTPKRRCTALCCAEKRRLHPAPPPSSGVGVQSALNAPRRLLRRRPPHPLLRRGAGCGGAISGAALSQYPTCFIIPHSFGFVNSECCTNSASLRLWCSRTRTPQP